VLVAADTHVMGFTMYEDVNSYMVSMTAAVVSKIA